MRRLIVLLAVVAAVAAVCAGWKWGNAAQAARLIECSPYCRVDSGPPPHLPASGPCYYHWGVRI